ncbi:MAG: alpha-amylase family glycosyl hydrolase [Aggregatilineales bacterium]
MKRFLLLLVLLALLLPTLALTAQDDAPTESDLPWWNDRVFYEIFVRSFYDSDGDGIGDLQGVISQLDYLNDGDPTTDSDLGITGIWLMPINPSPSYHGYDVTDYLGVNSEYGTLDDMRQLIEEAHARGIAVIIDFVLNHSSVEHEWFIESQNPDSDFRDYYVWEDENPGFRGPEGQQVWYQTAGRYYYAVFWSGMPDLNYANPDLTAQMMEASRFWIEDIGVDGFRLDAIKFLISDGERQENTPETVAWFEAYRASLRESNADNLLVGEIWDSTSTVSSYTDRAVDIAFEFDLAAGIVRGAAFGITSSIDSALETVLESYPAGQYATFLTNHDQDRVMNQLRGEVGSAKSAAAVILTLPGVPFIYYGEEIGMVGVKPDEDIRTPMQWSDGENAGFTGGDPWRAVNADFADGVNVAAQSDDANSLLTHYRALIHARNENPALLRGDITVIDSGSGNVISFLRHTADQTVLVVINMRPREVDNYGLTLESSVLSDLTNINLMLASSHEPFEADGAFALPELNAEGGFADYLPLPVLPGNSVFILEFE